MGSASGFFFPLALTFGVSYISSISSGYYSSYSAFLSLFLDIS